MCITSGGSRVYLCLPLFEYPPSLLQYHRNTFTNPEFGMQGHHFPSIPALKPRYSAFLFRKIPPPANSTSNSQPQFYNAYPQNALPPPSPQFPRCLQHPLLHPSSVLPLPRLDCETRPLSTHLPQLFLHVPPLATKYQTHSTHAPLAPLPTRRPPIRHFRTPGI